MINVTDTARDGVAALSARLAEIGAERADSAPDAAQIAEAWRATLAEVATAPAEGTARGWFASRDGAEVHTLQATITAAPDAAPDAAMAARSVWTPGARRVDASRASYVTLGGSRRDYAGLRVIAATPGALLGLAEFGEDWHVVLYTAEAPVAPAPVAPAALAAPVAIEYAHPADVGEVDGTGEPFTCYHANAAHTARPDTAGHGIPRYTGRGCAHEHVEIRTELTYPAAVQALGIAGDSYAAYIQRSMAAKVARGMRSGGESLGALYVGNDGE